MQINKFFALTLGKSFTRYGFSNAKSSLTLSKDFLTNLKGQSQKLLLKETVS